MQATEFPIELVKGSVVGNDFRNLRSEQEIMQNWTGDVSKPLVSICCITYNHEAFIEDALQGFLIQETDFPFEILIHDDASTDKTVDIIRKYQANYPNLISPIYQKENQYSLGIKISPTFQYPRSKGVYIAYCEGDDFWHDPQKLQLQVEYLSAHAECGFVHSDYDAYHQEDQVTVASFYKSKCVLHAETDFILADMLRARYLIATCTVCIRSELLRRVIMEYGDLILGPFPVGDFQTWFCCVAGYGACPGFIDKSLATYRVLAESASHSTDVAKSIGYEKGRLALFLQLIERFDIDQSLEKDVLRRFWGRLLYLAHVARDTGLAAEAASALREVNKSLTLHEHLYHWGTMGSAARICILCGLFALAAPGRISCAIGRLSIWGGTSVKAL